MNTGSSAPPVEADHGSSTTVSRRRLLKASLFSLPFVVAACSSQAASILPTQTTATAPTPQSTLPATSTIAPTAQVAAATSTIAPATKVVAAPTAVSASPTVSGTTLTPTDASVDPGEATIAVTEGPYFKANSPERASLMDAGVVGTPLTLTGQVVSTKGQPIAKALLDFWQADGRGSYDNTGYLLRGHQFTDAEGKYKLETVVPGLYPGRTRHIHVKVQAPNGPILTTSALFSERARERVRLDLQFQAPRHRDGRPQCHQVGHLPIRFESGVAG